LETESVEEGFRGRLSSLYYNIIKPILANKRATVGLFILLGFILMATIGPILVPLDLTMRGLSHHPSSIPLEPTMLEETYSNR